MSEQGQDKTEKAAEGDGDKLVTLGHVTGAHGLQGWIKVHSDTSPRENIATYGRLLLNQGEGQGGKWQSWKVSSGRRQGKNVVLKLKGCNDRDMAEALAGAKIAIYRDQLPELDAPDEFYWTDLEGLTVETTEGESLGEIDHLFETGSNDVLVVKGDRERLIPFIWEQVVQEVDLEERRMVVDWDPEF
jgi:16S rRNA processing protein RimM